MSDYIPIDPPPYVPPTYTYRLRRRGHVERIEDGLFLVPDESNADWRLYLDWLAAGNTAEPAEPEPDEDVSRRARRAHLRANAVIQALATATPAEVDSYIDAQVVDLASARRVLKALAIAVSILLKEGL
jgi:hypothetical protein